jgi:tetratricopeptide (TPR) repeat protein
VEWRAKDTLVAMLLGLSVCAMGTPDLERRARDAVAAHNLVEARNLYRRLAEQHPETVAHQIWVGRLSSWLNDYATANAAFDRVLADDPDNAEALLGKAYVAMWQDQFGLADGLLARAARAAPDDAQVQLALARNYHFQGMERDAAQHVERALALDPGSVDALELQRRLAPAPARPGFLARLKRLFTGRS